MSNLTYLASAQSFVDSLEHITGFIVVLVALTVLWGATILSGKVFAPRAPKAAAAPAVPTAASAVKPVVAAAASDEPSDEEVVAICACVAALLEERHRIVSIRSANPYWGREGLREHFASHRLR
jgi:hypothetical protein